MEDNFGNPAAILQDFSPSKQKTNDWGIRAFTRALCSIKVDSQTGHTLHRLARFRTHVPIHHFCTLALAIVYLTTTCPTDAETIHVGGQRAAVANPTDSHESDHDGSTFRAISFTAQRSGLVRAISFEGIYSSDKPPTNDQFTAVFFNGGSSAFEMKHRFTELLTVEIV